jgi:outer membrane protein TolC
MRRIPSSLTLPALLMLGAGARRLGVPARSALPAQFSTPQKAEASADRLDRWWLIFADPQLTAMEEEALARPRCALGARRAGRGARDALEGLADL